MTHVDQWFSSLSADDRRDVLYALNCFRGLGDTLAPRTAIEHARELWPRLEGLLRALEEDHEDLKSSEESRPTIPSPRESGAFSVFPGAPDSKRSK